MLYLSFIDKQRKRCEGRPTQKTQREEKHTPPPPDLDQFWLFFLYVFLLPMSLSYINWASQEGCLFFLRSSLQSSDLSLFYFHGSFPSLSFSHCHFGFLFPILTTQRIQADRCSRWLMHWRRLNPISFLLD